MYLINLENKQTDTKLKDPKIKYVQSLFMRKTNTKEHKI